MTLQSCGFVCETTNVKKWNKLKHTVVLHISYCSSAMADHLWGNPPGKEIGNTELNQPLYLSIFFPTSWRQSAEQTLRWRNKLLCDLSKKTKTPSDLRWVLLILSVFHHNYLSVSKLATMHVCIHMYSHLLMPPFEIKLYYVNVIWNQGRPQSGIVVLYSNPLSGHMMALMECK